MAKQFSMEGTVMELLQESHEFLKLKAQRMI